MMMFEKIIIDSLESLNVTVGMMGSAVGACFYLICVSRMSVDVGQPDLLASGSDRRGGRSELL